MKHTKIIVFTIISCLFASKSGADDSVQTSGDPSRKESSNPSVTKTVQIAASPDENGIQLPNLQGSGDASVTMKVQVAANPDENDVHQPNLQGSGDPSVTLKVQIAANPGENGIQQPYQQTNANSKLKNVEAQSPTDTENESQNTENEEIDHPLKNSDLKRQSETVEMSEQSNGVEKNEDATSEEADDVPTVIETKTSDSKEEEINHKISLSDVNSYTADQSHTRPTKRDTRHVQLLELPHDASYFFDDLEPFINNNSDNRVGRAAPLHETKSQRAKFSGKSKENLENYLEDQEDDPENDEDENNDEEECEYDDEDDDEECETSTTCPPTTTTCPPTTTTCPPTTTTCPPATTTCPPSTTTCPTTTRCPTRITCKTTRSKCTTKCPRICAKDDRKSIAFRIADTDDRNTDREKSYGKKKKKHWKNFGN